MDELKEMVTKYEFTEEENLLLSGLARGLLKLGVAVLVAGMLLVLYIVISFFDPVPLLSISDTKYAVLSTADYALWVLISVLVIYLSVTVIKLSVPIRLITKTTGTDISYLMSFVKSLTRIAGLSFVSLIAICILLLISLVLMILVF
ncbi:MAG: hypothetical protein NTX36_07605 [Proteobacteria bacterium]|nr:hypothetical protein [Pseudomonadota bacterium]